MSCMIPGAVVLARPAPDSRTDAPRGTQQTSRAPAQRQVWRMRMACVSPCFEEFPCPRGRPGFCRDAPEEDDLSCCGTASLLALGKWPGGAGDLVGQLGQQLLVSLDQGVIARTDLGSDLGGACQRALALQGPQAPGCVDQCIAARRRIETTDIDLDPQHRLVADRQAGDILGIECTCKIGR